MWSDLWSKADVITRAQWAVGMLGFAAWCRLFYWQHQVRSPVVLDRIKLEPWGSLARISMMPPKDFLGPEELLYARNMHPWGILFVCCWAAGLAMHFLKGFAIWCAGSLIGEAI